jgi:hypothetical protein
VHTLQKEFMIFRFRAGSHAQLATTTTSDSEWSKSIDDKSIAQVIKNQMKSTYANDYINNLEEKIRLEEEAKHSRKIKDSNNFKRASSSSSFLHNVPFSYESLYISPTRYGSNRLHKVPAYGIVPECSRFWHDFDQQKTISN